MTKKTKGPSKGSGKSCSLEERKFRNHMYSHGLRIDACLLAERIGAPAAAERIGVTAASIYRWKKAYAASIGQV